MAKGPGDAVIGGTVNVGGPLRLRVARVGADTALAQIVRLVETAQVGRACPLLGCCPGRLLPSCALTQLGAAPPP